jgi:hypothetical protein
MALAGVLLLCLVAVERRSAAPFADREIVTAPLFLWPTLATALVSFTMLGLLFMVPLYLQAVRGDTALQTGLKLMPVMLALVAGAGIGTAGQRRWSLRSLVSGGLVVTALGFALLTGVTRTSGYSTLLGALVLIGLGFGISMPPAMDAMLSSLPVKREGTGVAINQAIKQLGGALGVSILGNLLATAYSSGVGPASSALPPSLAAVARESIAGADAVAGQLGGIAGTTLHEAAGAAYVSGMRQVSIACALAALLSAALLARLLPARDETTANVADPIPVELQA